MTPPKQTIDKIHLETSGVIWKHLGNLEAPRRHPADTKKAPKGTQEAPRGHPGATQEAPRSHPEAPRAPERLLR